MQALLDLVFPPRCAGCDRPGVLLCDECARAVPLIDSASACRRCGAPRASRGGACPECVGRAFAFSAARCAALLEHPVSRAVVVLKDGGERRYASVLAGLLADAASGWLAPDEVLVPVPASPDAVRRRGFDHAWDLTRALAGRVGVAAAQVLRSARSADQRELGRSERFANRAGTFVARPGAAVPERIVLVDDVFTTGATFDAAARALLDSGAAHVRVLAVARARGHPGG